MKLSENPEICLEIQIQQTHSAYLSWHMQVTENKTCTYSAHLK